MPSQLLPDTEWEEKVGYPTHTIVGVDEVGRGCLAGPVVAAALVLPFVLDLKQTPWLKEVRDSKLLTPGSRERLEPLIQNWAKAFAIGIASVEEIDRLNIHHASHLAMVRAIKSLNGRADHILVDGKFVPKGLDCQVTPIIKGDQKCLSIACASILAKVWRDRHMVELDQRFPNYGLAIHKGYATPSHKNALKLYGASIIHRRSFRPVANHIL